MCPLIEHEDRKRLAEYANKLKFNDHDEIKDPLDVSYNSPWLSEEQGIFMWPSMYYHDIAIYLKHLAPEFLNRLEAEYKLGKAYRYFSCDFVRKVLYSEVSDELCILKCKVIPSHSMNNKPYDVWAVLRRDKNEKPGGEILSGYCTCVAGLHGSCNHVIGMLFRIEAAVAKGATRPSTTSITCQWTIPSGNKINLAPTKAEELYIVKSKYGKKSTEAKVKSAKDSMNTYKPSLHKKHLSALKDVEGLRNSLFSAIKENIQNSCLSEVMQGRSNQGSVAKKTIPMPITSMVTNLLSHHHPSDILPLLKLTDEQCSTIEEVTRNQSDNPIWYEQRRGRITASKFYRVCTRAESCLADKAKNALALTQEIMGRNQTAQTLAMKHGLAMEPHAKRKLLEIFKANHKKVTYYETGLIVSSEFPHLGASPDLIISCGCHGKYVVEIKCPETIKMTTPSVQNLNYLVRIDEDVTQLKKRHAYYFQIQGQMGISKIDKSIFFVYTHHGFYAEQIQFDRELFEQMLIKFNYFWSKFIVPEIIEKSDSNDHVSTDRAKRPIVRLVEENKNTQTKVICGICMKAILNDVSDPLDYSIECRSCLSWCHIKCVNVSEEQFHDEKFAWICKSCPAIDFNVI